MIGKLDLAFLRVRVSPMTLPVIDLPYPALNDEEVHNLSRDESYNRIKEKGYTHYLIYLVN